MLMSFHIISKETGQEILTPSCSKKSYAIVTDQILPAQLTTEQLLLEYDATTTSEQEGIKMGGGGGRG
jgi:hypothetical protein